MEQCHQCYQWYQQDQQHQLTTVFWINHFAECNWDFVMAPSKQTGIYWKMHYNKEFSSGLFFTSEHQRVGIIPDRISDLCPTTESK